MFPFLSVNKLIMHTLRFFLCSLNVDDAFVLKENLMQGMGTFRCGRMLAAESFGPRCTRTSKWSLFFR